MAAHSSILAWRIPQTEGPGRLQSMGLQRVRHNCLYFFIHLSVDGHLGCFHFLAIVNNASVNMKMQISLQYNIIIFSGHIPESGIAGSYNSSDGKESTAMLESQVRSLGQEDPLEKEKATCCSILARKIA